LRDQIEALGGTLGIDPTVAGQLSLIAELNLSESPGQLVIVRELMPGHAGFDTAFYRDVAARSSGGCR
jgi:hypothetical protein